MTACPICDMELNGRDGRAKAHIKACEAIEMGLLADQLTPTVEEKPEGFDYPEADNRRPAAVPRLLARLGCSPAVPRPLS